MPSATLLYPSTSLNHSVTHTLWLPLSHPSRHLSQSWSPHSLFSQLFCESHSLKANAFRWVWGRDLWPIMIVARGICDAPRDTWTPPRPYTQFEVLPPAYTNDKWESIHQISGSGGWLEILWRQTSLQVCFVWKSWFVDISFFFLMHWTYFLPILFSIIQSKADRKARGSIHVWVPLSVFENTTRGRVEIAKYWNRK